MRRMDYPIAKAKELDLTDKEWFQRDGLHWFLKKKLPNGIYHLTGYNPQEQDYQYVHLYFQTSNSAPSVSIGCKALFLIPGYDNYEELKKLTMIDTFSDGLIDEKPEFSLNPESYIIANNNIYLVVKDGIVLLTTHSEL